MMKLVENLFILIAFVTITEAVNCPDSCRCKWILDSLKVDCSELGLSVLPDFGDLPIEILDLSNNAFTEFPSGLSRVETLTNLDLSRNYITNLEPFALTNFTSLNTLLLNGNRLTTPPEVSIFKGNPNLSQLWLGNNPWRCDCQDSHFKEFYLFVFQRPSKFQLNDKIQVKCASPDNFYGRSWENACFQNWFPGNHKSLSEKVLSLPGYIIILVVIIISFTISCERKKRKMRQNRMMIEQEANEDLSYDSTKKSPYAQRQPGSPLAGRSISQWTISSNSDKNEFRESDINLDEGYYSKPQSVRGSFNDLQVIASKDHIREYIDDPIDIVHRQQNLNESKI